MSALHRILVWAAGVSVLLLGWSVAHADAGVAEIAFWGVVPLIFAATVTAMLARRSPVRTELVALVVIALSLRCALGVFMYSEVLAGRGFGSLFIKDDRFFFDWGVQIARAWNEGILVPFLPGRTQPGHLFFHAAPIWIFGPDPRNVVVVSSLVGAGSVLTLFSIARRFVPAGVALLAGALLAVYPHHVYLAAANQRDAVITLLVLLLVLVMVKGAEQERFGLRVPFHVALTLLIIAVAVWRLPLGAALLPVIGVWALVAGPRPRTWTAAWLTGTVLIFLVVGSLLPEDPVGGEGISGLFAVVDQAYGSRFAAAQTFGFFGDGGIAHVLWLPLTLPLALLFGFVPRQDTVNDALVSLGFLYYWYPLLPLMVVGGMAVFRGRWRSTFALWGTSLAVVLLGAAAFFGLIPRFRSAAEPLLLLLAAVGIVRARQWLPAYLPLVLSACLLLQLFVWRLPESRPLVLAVAVTSAGLGLWALVRPRLRALAGGAQAAARLPGR